MKFTTIYKNGKPQNFFIKIDNEKEFAFLHPYFIVTDCDHTRKGNILTMECLFSGSVWYGRQRHGYGYSCSADVYGELINIILKLHKKDLSQNTIDELKKINVHEDNLQLKESILDELSKLNQIALEKKYNI